MAIIKGRAGKVFIGANAALHVQSFNITHEISTLPYDAMGDEYADHLLDLKSWTASITCLYDPADTNGQGALVLGAEVAVKLYPQGNDTGKPEYSGTVSITSTPLSVTKDAITQSTFECMGKGALTIGVVA